MKSKLTQALDIRDAALRWVEKEDLRIGRSESRVEYEFRIMTIGPSVYTTRVQVEMPLSSAASNPEAMDRSVRVSRGDSAEGPFQLLMQLDWNADDTRAELQSHKAGWERELHGWGQRI